MSRVARCTGSYPFSLSPCVSEILTPGQYSIVTTFFVHSSSYIFGIFTDFDFSKFFANVTAASRSTSKSTSRKRTSPDVFAIAFQLAPTASVCGSKRSARRATRLMFFRSILKSSSRFSRCTLTITSSPVLRTARCTCASDAAASSVGSKLA